MRRFLKWAGMGFAVVALGLAILFVVGWVVTDRALARVYEIQDPPIPAAQGAQALLRGKHLFETRNCGDCHGAGGAGRILFQSPMLGTIVTTNLTRVVRDPAYTDDALAAAIRHGVHSDGTPLVFMPSGDYADLDDNDVAALVAYLRMLPANDHDPGRTTLRPLARVLYTLGKLPLFPAESIDHAPRPRKAPPPVVGVEYGRYIAQACTGCHGTDFAGGLVIEPGKPPSANLTPHANGLATWTEADFLRLMQSGERPDGRQVDPLMPWNTYRRMDAVELRAIWAYLDSLEPVPGAARGN